MGAKGSHQQSINEKSLFKPLPQQYEQSAQDPSIYYFKKVQQKTMQEPLNYQLKQNLEKQQQLKLSSVNQRHPYARIPKVQYFTVVLNPQQYEPYIKHLAFRREHQEHLIQIPFIELSKKDSLYCKLKLYVQYIPITLEQIINVHYLDMLTILYWTIKGLQRLCKHYQHSHAFTAKMIGFTQSGQVKIWVNDKFTSGQGKIETFYHSHVWSKKRQAKNNGSAQSNNNNSIKNSHASNYNQQLIGQLGPETEKQTQLNIQQQVILQNLQKVINKHIDHQSIPVHLSNSRVFSSSKSQLMNQKSQLGINTRCSQPMQRSPSRVVSQVYPISPISESLNTKQSQTQKIQTYCINSDRMRLKLGRSYQEVLQWIESHSGKVPTRVASVASLLQSGRALFIKPDKGTSIKGSSLQTSRCVISMKHEHYSKELKKVIKFNYWSNANDSPSNQPKNSGVQFTYGRLSHSNSVDSIMKPILRDKAKDNQYIPNKQLVVLSSINEYAKFEFRENNNGQSLRLGQKNCIQQKSNSYQSQHVNCRQKDFFKIKQHVQDCRSKASENKPSTIIQRLHQRYSQQFGRRLPSKESELITNLNAEYRLESRIQSEISNINISNLHSSEVSPRKSQKRVRSNSFNE